MKAPPPPPKRDAPQIEKGVSSAEKDAQQRPRECKLLKLWNYIITIPFSSLVTSARIKELPPWRCMFSSWWFNCLHTCLQHLHEGSQLHLHGNDLQIEGLNHPGVHLTHHLGVVLILRLFVADQILLLSGVVTHLLAGDHCLQLEGALLLHHLGGIGHRCGNQCLNNFYKSIRSVNGSLELLTLFSQPQSFT